MADTQKKKPHRMVDDGLDEAKTTFEMVKVSNDEVEEVLKRLKNEKPSEA